MQDSCYQPGMTPVEEALASMILTISQTKDNLQTENIPLSDAVGRILAEDVIAQVDVPPSDNSAMDGYALRASDLNNTDTLTLQGTVLAGQVFSNELKHEHCIRIMTGAPIPKGADAVVMQEQTSKVDDLVTFETTPIEGANVRKSGENIAIGSTVLSQGLRLTAASISLVASIGISHVTVYRKLKIGIMATGDELVEPGGILNQGQIYESNRIMVNALLTQFGAECIDYGIIADDMQATRDAFVTANEECDALVSSGGVSVGEADFVKDVLDELGEINLWKIAIKPGKPFAFGKLSNAWFFGLPGNPVSSYVTCQQIVMQLLSELQNEKVQAVSLINGVAGADIRKQPGRKDFQRGIYHIEEDGSYVARPNGPQGSGIMTSVARANCYIVLEADQGRLSKGEPIKILPFSQFLVG